MHTEPDHRIPSSPRTTAILRRPLVTSKSATNSRNVRTAGPKLQVPGGIFKVYAFSPSRLLGEQWFARQRAVGVQKACSVYLSSIGLVALHVAQDMLTQPKEKGGLANTRKGTRQRNRKQNKGKQDKTNTSCSKNKRKETRRWGQVDNGEREGGAALDFTNYVAGLPPSSLHLLPGPTETRTTRLSRCDAYSSSASGSHGILRTGPRNPHFSM